MGPLEEGQGSHGEQNKSSFANFCLLICPSPLLAIGLVTFGPGLTKVRILPAFRGVARAHELSRGILLLCCPVSNTSHTSFEDSALTVNWSADIVR